MAGRGGLIQVERLNHETLVLDGLALALAFFATDSGPAGSGHAERIELADVMAMNRTMRARSPHRVWSSIVGAEAPWLSAIPADLDLIELDDARWREAGGDELVAAALAAIIGPGRGMAVATKLLHLKRPRLFPMLDRLVAEMFGVAAADDAAPEQRVETAVRLARAIRAEGRRNLGALGVIRAALSAEGVDRSLVRILDAILWSAHPAAGVSGLRRTLTVDGR